MSEKKFENVSKKVKTLWVLSRIWLLIPGLFPLLLGLLVDDLPQALKIILIVYSAITLVFAFVLIVVLPPFQYKKYLYLIKDDEVVIMRGVIFKESYVIPIVQVQDIGYIEGPINQILGLCNIIISTSGSTRNIAGIEKEKAIEIVNNVKEKVKEYIKRRDEAK